MNNHKKSVSNKSGQAHAQLAPTYAHLRPRTPAYL